MDKASVGQKVKYVKPDAYPGYKAPADLIVGDVYTIRKIKEYPRDHKLSGDMNFEFEETDEGRNYGAKRFEPAPSNTKTVHRGFNL